MKCSHVPENRICGPCTRKEYPDWVGPIFDFEEGDVVYHKAYDRKFKVTKIYGHGSLIMTEEGTTISMGHLMPIRATRILP
jgi:hypothetical protein